jgi:hypothetical protein
LTSPSRRHLGHYKVLLTENKRQDHPEEEDHGHEIMQVYYEIATAAINQGISLNRWQQSITSMIKKVPGSPKINKLRVIHLYEADYNLFLKILWARRLVWHMHDNDKINDGQAGSRPGRNAIDVVIQKEMKYLYSRLTCTGLATMDNDTKSCYDRIICNFAMIISQYYGIKSKTAKVQATTLKKMQYRLRTALGDSKEYYEHTEETPVHGTGQGSCASPAIWLMIEDLLAWKDLLGVSGGKLELSKCFY